MYKIVFFDVDGTLLSEVDRTIPISAKEAIRQLISNGTKVVVATGRPYSLCEEFKSMGIDTFISANGALIKCNETTIHKSVIARETIAKITEFAKIHGQHVSYFTESFMMNGMEPDNNRVLEALEETLGINVYPEIVEDVLDEVYCICLYADEQEVGKFIDYFPELRFQRFHKYVCNVLERTEVSKSIAIREVLNYYNISRSEAIAFGDGLNDIDMLSYVGLGIAMGNGNDSLKGVADFVTKKASEGGIHHALKEYGML
ncbi:Cof-type HAD-IIB family hydrolase [Paenibacillus sp. Marseille-Q4541]|uniref:Cof-type HAD-IIB family hydrolase n=1 Tax=Paenibacillus sp. Marseille-Q4541 TaxID=2831522 RepID=UPI001BA64406|nr:Cof-type HAD-IIB family hydrolase [Paenibacillus sp. Marseille-Q4541]